MNKTIKYLAMIVLAITPALQAEVGLNLGYSANYKATFTGPAVTLNATDFGAATGGIDHEYEDGFNRVDSSGNFNDETTYWGYENDSQYDESTKLLTLSSRRSTIGSYQTQGTQTASQPAIEAYWSRSLTQQQRWNIGLRAAIRWQRIELDHRTRLNRSVERISDSYEFLGENIIGAPFYGSYEGTNAMFRAIPSRTITPLAQDSVIVRQDIDAHLFALDFGQTFDLHLNDRIDLSLTAGGTIAWMTSEFSYSGGLDGSGSDTAEDFLLGEYVGLDLKYQATEHWGLSAGIAYTLLQDFDQRADQHTAELTFRDVYQTRIGIFYRP